MPVIRWIVNAMIYLGSALMLYNIISFIRFVLRIQEKKDWKEKRAFLYVPIVLLILFLIGYLTVGFLGNPDLVISSILFGGSIFVYLMFRWLCRITDRIQEDEQMQAKLLAMEESNKEKVTFLSSMSHEMRTPMNAIIGLDTMILQDEKLAPQTRDRAEKIGISAKHMMDLINDILDMNRFESGTMALRNEEFSLREMLELLSLLIQTQCSESGLEFSHEIIGEMDEAYLGDRLRLRQALLAILENAVKFTHAPGRVSFVTEASPAGEGETLLRFIIRDTGIGIDASFIPRLFDSFTQEDAGSTNRYGGSGLGLAISKRIIDLMNGRIDVESSKEKGSVFTVSVALKRAEKKPQDEADAAEKEKNDLRGRRILIVEDIDLNAEIVADLLEMEEILSERAENGQIAVDMFSRSASGYYDAILMDLRMPVMDGLEATRRIRALDRPDAKTVPIIALTANAYEEDVRNSLEAGMTVHLSKPTDSDQLYETLGKLICRK